MMLKYKNNMLSILKISYKNVFRNWRRSFLTLTAIIISVIFTNYGISLVNGQKNQMTRTGRTTNTGDQKIFTAEYFEERENLPIDKNLTDYVGICDKLRNINEIEALSPRIIFSVRIFFDGEELICKGAGIFPEMEDKVFSRRKGIIQGEYLNEKDEKILIGSELAELLNIKAGDWITVASRTKYGTITAIDVEIKGILEADNPEIDNFFVFFSLSAADEFLEMEREVTEISVKLKNYKNSVTVKTKIENLLNSGKYKILTWQDELADIIYLINLRMKSVNILSFLLFIMAAFVIANTMLMSVFERKKEIGTLMALGMKNKEILSMILGEGVFIGLFGGFLGSFFGGLIAYFFSVHGLSFEAWKSMNMNMPFKGTLYGEFSMDFIIVIFIISVAVAVFSSIYPAVKVTKFRPAQILDTSEI